MPEPSECVGWEQGRGVTQHLSILAQKFGMLVCARYIGQRATPEDDQMQRLRPNDRT